MNDLVAFLNERVPKGVEITPSNLRVLLADFADLTDEAYGGAEIDWLIRAGHMTEFPHIWKG